MRALILKENGVLPQCEATADPVPSEGQVVVHVKAASLNHRDLWIVKGQYPNIKFPLIQGSDGVGVFEGKEVVLQPGYGWGENEQFQGMNYQILGLPQDGTFADKVVVNHNQIFPKPKHLTMEAAAALPLAGLTAFRALFSRCKAVAGERLLVTGGGGGVASLCIQFALKAGVHVFVTTGSEEKLEKWTTLGVSGGAIYRQQNWPEELKHQAGGGFDVIIDGTGGSGFMQLVKLANPGGRIGVYGGTLGKVPDFSPQPIFWKQISILGTTMGSDRDFQEMLSFVDEHKIVPVVDSVFGLEEGADAFRRLESGQHFGKIILKMA